MLNGVIPEKYSGYLFSALRIMTGLLFLEHGTSKLLGFPYADMSQMPATMLWITGLLELIGGALIAVGLLTRLTAFILAGFMAVAYFMAHASQNFFPMINHGEAAILFCFVFLYFAVAGAGPYSVDASRQ